MSNLTRSFIDGLLPPGSAFRVAKGLDLDHLIDGMAVNMDTPYGWTQKVKSVRDPLYTSLLDELEHDLGVTKNTNLTEAVRRANLATRKFSKASSTIPAIQVALDANGFGAGGYGLTVYDNNGGANPQVFLTVVPLMMAGQTNAVAGNNLAYAGLTGSGTGMLIVNGYVPQSTPNYWGAGMTQMVAGNMVAEAGYYTSQTTTTTNYTVPQDSGYWPAIFFIGGTATLVNGQITGLSAPNVPTVRQTELIELICRLKPIWTWCVLVANWI